MPNRKIKSLRVSFSIMIESEFKEDLREEEDNDIEKAYYIDFKKRKPQCSNNRVSLLSNMLHSSSTTNTITTAENLSDTSLPESLKQHVEIERSQASLKTKVKCGSEATKEHSNTTPWNDNFSKW